METMDGGAVLTGFGLPVTQSVVSWGETIRVDASGHMGR